MPTFRSNRPIVGITMGDASGIGPEVIAKALASLGRLGLAYFLVIGDGGVFRSAIDELRIPLNLTTIDHINDAVFDHKHSIALLDMKNLKLRELRRGEVNPACGRASIEYIQEAVKLALERRIDAVVTAPISKEAVKLAGFDWPGHTEFLAHLTETEDFAMMVVGGPLKVVLVTTHLALQKVSESITQAKVYRTVELTHRWLKGNFGLLSPRIGVSSLNPHCGEAGIFGNEEAEKIRPAVERAKAEGIDARGPIPSDALFKQAYKGQYDAVIAMYHDQGLIPIKMIAGEVGVNVTLGLPLIRTSPAHGTAFDIAGRGEASPRSMIKAIEMAIDLIKKRDEG